MLTDVLRQFAITAVILVVVIAFGAAIKPMSSDNLVTGWDVAKYLVFAIVPMLQFALPFSGAFAATIGLHRMSQDNEIIAMSVSGQSYVRLLAPMALFGVILTLLVALLTQSIIPLFVGKMTTAMSKDLPRLLTNSIKQHTPFVEKNMIIWAEDIFVIEDGDQERMALEHMAVAKIDDTGRANMYLTAAASVVDVKRTGGQTSMLVNFKDSAQWTSNADGSGFLRGAKEGHLTHAIDLPSLTKQRPSSLTRSALLDLRTYPRKYPKVNAAAIALESSLSEIRFFDKVNEQFQVSNSLACDTVTGGRELVITANKMKGSTFVPPITVISISGTGEERVLNPKYARLIVDQTETGIIDSVTFQMKDVIVGAGEVGENLRGELVVPSLRIRDLPLQSETRELTVSEILALADTSQSKTVLKSANRLRLQLSQMEGQIIGRIGQRWAVSVLPLLAIVLGSLFAIRFSTKPPLSVYAKVFTPTVVALLLVFAGGQMVRDAREISGFAIMWSGNLGLTFMVFFNWMLLRKN
jgi:lipopolysaccharide export LptBFGC system permease protein LptF